MANAMYAVDPWNQNVFATPTNIGANATDAAYPVANLLDNNPGSLWKATAGTSALQLQFDFGSAINIRLVALFNHNFTGGTISLKGNATASWGSPTFSQNFTIGSIDEDRYYPNTYLDINQTFRYWLLASAAGNGTTLLANAPWALGEIAFYNTRVQLTNNLLYPYSDEDMRDGQKIYQTAGGTQWATGSLGRRRRFISTLDGSDAINAPEVRQWIRYSDGQSKPSLFIIDPAAAQPDCRMVYHAAPYKREASVLDRNVQKIDLIEAAMGIPNFNLGF